MRCSISSSRALAAGIVASSSVISPPPSHQEEPAVEELEAQRQARMVGVRLRQVVAQLHHVAVELVGVPGGIPAHALGQAVLAPGDQAYHHQRRRQQQQRADGAELDAQGQAQHGTLPIAGPQGA